MLAADFQFISDLLKKRSGLALTEDKSYLLESRLTPIAQTHGCADLSALIERVRAGGKEAVVAEIIEAMTTNESLFFRDGKPFDYLRQTLIGEYKTMAGKNSLRVWSAAASTGQEPYTIAICLLEESAKLPGWRFDIVGTDLANKVLDKAREGKYTQFEVQRGLPIQMLIKYFTQLPNTAWQIKETVRSMVSYRMQNLLEDCSSLGKFDMIFCRNVLIYFDEPTKAQVVERLSRSLMHGGYLFLGSTETIIDPQQLFKPVEACRGLYRLK